MLRATRWVTGSAVRDLMLFAFVWAWMAQLLIPFGEASAIPDINPFLLLLGVFFLLDYALRQAWIRILLKLLIVAGFVYFFDYRAYSALDLQWVVRWFHELVYSAEAAIESGVQTTSVMSPAVSNTLFMLVLWLFQALFRQGLRSRFWIVIFLILGGVGLGVLDTFFIKDAKMYVILFLLIGLLILAFTQLPHIERVARLPLRMKGWPLQWLLWTLVMSMIVVGTSFAAPKTELPSWPDPVAYLQGQISNVNAPHKIGYGNDDSKLGGPFDMDDTVVFDVVTTAPTYYMGETKTVYTGKGWLSSAVPQPLADTSALDTTLQSNGPLLNSNSDNSKQVVQTYTIENSHLLPVLFNQYDLQSVQFVHAKSPETFYYDQVDNKISMDSYQTGDSYRVVSQVPYYDESVLEKATIPVNDMMMAPYLMLPTTLPTRVADLARQITKDAKTPYDKAKALETYLRNNYTYDNKNIPVPGKNQDYVDQFLFETKKGYCDNFSTAFAVMARVVGLPTRWVKGFTTGDQDMNFKSSNPNEVRYIVRNRNAHSWPEVYFNGLGWVSFEPTATFSMPRVTKQVQTATAPLPVPNVTQTPQRDRSQSLQDNSSSGGPVFQVNWLTVLETAGYLIGVLLVLLLLFRRRLLTAYYLRRTYKGQDLAPDHIVGRLLLILAKFGWKRHQDMTLREYALYLSDNQMLRGREMIPLTQLYERAYYGKRPVNATEKTQIRDLWARMVRKAGRTKGKKDE